MTAMRPDARALIHAMPLGQVFTFTGYGLDLIKVNAEFYMSWQHRASATRRTLPALIAIDAVKPYAQVELRGKVDIILNASDRRLEEVTDDDSPG